jgi:hypothetical protein
MLISSLEPRTNLLLRLLETLEWDCFCPSPCGRGRGPLRSNGRVRGASDQTAVVETAFFFRPTGRKVPSP